MVKMLKQTLSAFSMAVLLVAGSSAALAYASTGGCCKPGAPCCYPGSPCCAGHHHEGAH